MCVGHLQNRLCDDLLRNNQLRIRRHYRLNRQTDGSCAGRLLRIPAAPGHYHLPPDMGSDAGRLHSVLRRHRTLGYM